VRRVANCYIRLLYFTTLGLGLVELCLGLVRLGLADRRTSGPQFAPHIPVLVDTDFSVDYLEKICCVRQMRVRTSVINVPVKRPLYSAIDVVASAERGCSK